MFKQDALGRFETQYTAEERIIRLKERRKKNNKKYFDSDKGKEKKKQATVRFLAKKEGLPIPLFPDPAPTRYEMSAISKAILKKFDII